jgi:hypothetical protein
MLTVLPQMRVNTGPGAAPRSSRQSLRAATGSVVALAVGDADDLAVAFGVGLGSADVEHDPGGLVFDVGQGEADQFGAAEGGGVAEQDHRGVSDADRGGAVDAVDFVMTESS